MKAPSIAPRVALRLPRALAGARVSSVPALAWVMAGIVAGGAVLRFWALGAIGFNTDEAVYVGQAASLLGDRDLSHLFPVFRAHPLLFHLNIALVFAFVGVSDIVARSIGALYGIGTLIAVFFAARELYQNRTGAVAALLLAVMPYHVVISRQAMLDGPMALATTVTLFCLARLGRTGNPAWLVAAAGALGVSTLIKEPAVILAGAIYVFIAVQNRLHISVRDLLLATGTLAVLVVSFPLAVAIAGHEETGRSYLVWQLLRRANHEWFFYFTILPTALGIPVLLGIIGAPLVQWRERSWRELLLALWIAVPLVFFTLWPVKGYAYLSAIAPAAAIIAARSIELLRDEAEARFPGAASKSRAAYGAVLTVSVVAMIFGSWLAVRPSSSGTFLAGTGGVVGGRETAEWLGANAPEGATVMTIGPSMANIVQFYGHRRALGLSVSPNPLHRNPSYEPITNPDLLIRQSDIQYVVWDTYSASRSEFFSERLLRYVSEYHGREVYRYELDTGDEPLAVTIVYEVRP